MIKSDILKKIEKKLEEDISKEIELIKREVFFILDKELDIYFLKEFAKYYPRKLLKEKAEILLDTLLNYFMKEILEDVKRLHPDIQYEFFKENLRDKIRNWALSENGRFYPLLPDIKEKESMLEKTLTIAPGVAVSAGGLIATAAIPETLPLKAIPAVSTLIGPIYIIKRIKDKNKRLKNMWKRQINAYLKYSKKELKNWLFQVEDRFLNELDNLYKKLDTIKPINEFNKNRRNINYVKI